MAESKIIGREYEQHILENICNKQESRVTIEEDGDPHEVARYNLQGLPVKKHQKGVQIVVFSNYTTKTIIVE